MIKIKLKDKTAELIAILFYNINKCNPMEVYTLVTTEKFKEVSKEFCDQYLKSKDV